MNSILIHETPHLLTIAINDNKRPQIVYTGSACNKTDSIVQILETIVGRFSEDEEGSLIRLFTAKDNCGRSSLRARQVLDDSSCLSQFHTYTINRDCQWPLELKERAVGFQLTDAETEAVSSLCFAIGLEDLQSICQIGLQTLMTIKSLTLASLKVFSEPASTPGDLSLYDLISSKIASKKAKRRLKTNLRSPWTDPKKLLKRRKMVEAFSHSTDHERIDDVRRQLRAFGSFGEGAVRQLTNGQLMDAADWSRLRLIVDHSLKLGSAIGQLIEVAELSDSLPHLELLSAEIARLEASGYLNEHRPTSSFTADLEQYMEVEASKLSRAPMEADLAIMCTPTLGCFLGLPDEQLGGLTLPSDWEAQIRQEGRTWFKTTELTRRFDPQCRIETEGSNYHSITASKEVYNHLLGISDHIFNVQDILIEIDLCQAFARLCSEKRWVLLDIENELDDIHIIALTNPLLAGKAVPNDLKLDSACRRKMILTGQNGAGKSVTMQAIGLAIILTQIGAPVPAESGRTLLFESLHYSIGHRTSDSEDLNNLERKLLLLDEFCFDVAPSIAAIRINEQLAIRGQRVIISTHLHEGLANFSDTVRAHIDIGTHKVTEDESDHVGNSTGLQAAAALGFPRHVIERAKVILATLEQGGIPRVE